MLFTSILARQVPFKLGFKTDDDELNAGFGANELSGFPSGTIGFSLVYTQKSC